MADDLNQAAEPGAPGEALKRTPVAWFGRGSAILARSSATAVEVFDQVGVWFEMVKFRFAPASTLADQVQPDEDDANDWTFLRRPALLGFIAVVMITAGSSLPSSPFKLELSGSWYFGVPGANQPTTQALLLLGLVSVYGGLILMMRVWYGLIKALLRRRGVPIKYLVMMLAAWIVPLLLVAPLFSRDVFSYAAQGEMMSRHINPYNYGPFTLGSGPYVNPVDSLWGNTPAPYGPLFLMIDGFFASASLHNELITVILLRLLAVAGVGMIAYCLPKLAESYGRDPGPVFALAVLNPLVLLTLIGGAHNDAIMVGLLISGITLAKRRHPVAGVIVCTLAAAIKAPAAIGIIYVAWTWVGTGLPWRSRLRPLFTAGIIAVAVMAFLSIVSGLGWGWIGNLATPGTVRSWLAPATGIGLTLTGIAHTFGLGVSQGGVLSMTRSLGLLGAAAAAVYLLWNSDRIGHIKALGLSLLLFVWLGPVVQPWYLTWGLVLLAPVALGRTRSVVIWMSIVAPFIGLTGGRTLIVELVHANPLAVLASVSVLLGLLVFPLGRWATSWRSADGFELEPGDEDLVTEFAPSAEISS